MQRYSRMSCPIDAVQRPLMVGALGTSLTWGSDLPSRERDAWPTVLQQLLRARTNRADIFVFNGAMRASSADFAALCFDELWGPAWADGRGLARAPRLDLAVIEYTWSSSASQVSALIETLHSRGIPVLGVLYYHPVNLARLTKIKNDQTPDYHASSIGKHVSYAHVFDQHSVPYINTSHLNDRHGWRKMMNTTRGILSAAHLSPLGHHGIATLLTEQIYSSKESCAASFRLPQPPSSSSGTSSASSGASPLPPPPRPRSDDFFCRIGTSLGDMLDTTRTRGWQVLVPADNRTPGIVATSLNASLSLLLPTPTNGRFMSLAFERSQWHQGTARVSCGGGCVCAPQEFDLHTTKKYTYLQRTRPRWLSARQSADGSSSSCTAAAAVASGWCEIAVQPITLTAGRLMIKAVTVSPPRAGNKSIGVNSLYSLP